MIPILNRGLDSSRDLARLTSSRFSSIEAALTDIRAGRLTVFIDNKSRKREGYLVCAAQFVTPQITRFMATRARSLLCLAMEGSRLNVLNLQSETNEQIQGLPTSIDATSPRCSARMVARFQAHTVQICLNSETKPDSLHNSGSIFFSKSRIGGVLARAGYAEAAVDLSRLAGLYPAGLVCEVQNPGDFSGKTDALLAFAQRHRLKVITMSNLIDHRLQHEVLVVREAITDLPTEFGSFKVLAYRTLADRSEHLAIVKGNLFGFQQQPAKVYIHSECLPGDAFGSLRCSCRNRLHAAMQMIEKAGQGIVIYLRPESRGAGLINKLNAYALKDLRLDNVDALEKQSPQSDSQHYSIAAQILKDIGVRQLILINDNPCITSELANLSITLVGSVCHGTTI